MIAVLVGWMPRRLYREVPDVPHRKPRAALALREILIEPLHFVACRTAVSSTSFRDQAQLAAGAARVLNRTRTMAVYLISPFACFRASIVAMLMMET
jgi:hypothetical protein